MHKARARNPWIIQPKPVEAPSVRLFCFPYAGGGASIFRTWPTLLPAGVDVCAIQYPGHESRIAEEPVSSIGVLVERMADAIAPYCDRPFIFFGHSMGAIAAFELARLRARSGQPGPSHLAVSGHGAPQRPNRMEKTSHLGDREFIEKLRCLDGTPPDVLDHAELMAVVLPALRADFAMCETYVFRPGPLLDCPITAYIGQEDDVSADDCDGWGDVTRATSRTYVLPGGHFLINTDRQALVAALAKDVMCSMSGLGIPLGA